MGTKGSPLKPCFIILEERGHFSNPEMSFKSGWGGVGRQNPRQGYMAYTPSRVSREDTGFRHVEWWEVCISYPALLNKC